MVNVSRGQVLAERVEDARSFGARLVGLLGRAALADGAGLWLEPCNSVHMAFMRFPIDVVFTAADGEVVAVVPNLKPWRMTRMYSGARVAIELPVGVVGRTGTAAGDRIRREVACA